MPLVDQVLPGDRRFGPLQEAQQVSGIGRKAEWWGTSDITSSFLLLHRVMRSHQR